MEWSFLWFAFQNGMLVDSQAKLHERTHLNLQETFSVKNDIHKTCHYAFISLPDQLLDLQAWLGSLVKILYLPTVKIPLYADYRKDHVKAMDNEKNIC